MVVAVNSILVGFCIMIYYSILKDLGRTTPLLMYTLTFHLGDSLWQNFNMALLARATRTSNSSGPGRRTTGSGRPSHALRLRAARVSNRVLYGDSTVQLQKPQEHNADTCSDAVIRPSTPLGNNLPPGAAATATAAFDEQMEQYELKSYVDDAVYIVTAALQHV